MKLLKPFTGLLMRESSNILYFIVDFLGLIPILTSPHKTGPL